MVVTIAASFSLSGPAASARADNFFAPTSVWNRELGPATPISPRSPEYVAELVRQIGETEAWINTNHYSVPIYTVGPDTPNVAVRILPPEGGLVDPALEAAMATVPVPIAAQPASGSDGHLVIYRPSTDEMWEFWVMRVEGGGWVAAYGGAIRNVSANPGYYDQNAWPGAEPDWGATASSLPLAAGLMRIPELEAGHIDHALALAIPEPSPEHVWPAQRSDGGNDAPSAIPEGTIFRLPADLDVASLHLPRLTEVMALAAQRHGVIVRDTSGCVCFYAEAPAPGEGNPYEQIFEEKYPDELLERFPWSSLEVVQPDPLEAGGLVGPGSGPWPTWVMPSP
ncbi:MAG TPA: hypothetical protein VH268_13555 [Solirubrobacterales bacterium]|nr:hypothetical protein [Solirubrobacterales bacterium]